MSARYLERLDQWEALAKHLMACQGPVAFDTEYEIGDDETVAFRGRLHVWSVAWSSDGVPNARGIRPAVGVVLPRESLELSPGILAWLADPTREKWAHNAGVDRHAIENTNGTRVRGVRDSLGISRWLFPERVAPGPGYGLDSLGKDFLGYGKTEDYVDLVSEWVPDEEVQGRKVRANRCVCGTEKCQKRKGPEHAKLRLVRFPLSTIVPGHRNFDRLLVYSAQDSVVDSELVQVFKKESLQREVPWFKS